MRIVPALDFRILPGPEAEGLTFLLKCIKNTRQALYVRPQEIDCTQRYVQTCTDHDERHSNFAVSGERGNLCFVT